MTFETSLHQTLHKLGLGPSDQYLKTGLSQLVQLLMDLDLSRSIDAEHYERSEQRTTYRNGYRKRRWKTIIGDVDLRIPKLRKGTYLPDFLDDCEGPLIDLLRYGYMQPSATLHIVDDKLSQLALFDDMPLHEIAQIEEVLHDLVYTERNAPLKQSITSLWLDMIDLGLHNGRTQTLLVAIGDDRHGGHHPLDFEITTDSDDEHTWAALLRRLITRGVQQVQSVISGDQGGLRSLVDEFFGAEWRYQRPYELQDVLYYVSENNQMTLTDAFSILYIALPDHTITYHTLDQTMPTSMLTSVA